MATVLLVEDDAPVRLVLRRTLEQAGHEVREAPDGTQALGSLEQAVPDIIVLDLHMPRLNGVGLLEHLRANPVSRAVPVIVITGAIVSEPRLGALEVGAVLRKPFKRTQLLYSIDRLLRLAGHDTTSTTSPAPRADRPTVLVVDDDPAAREMLETLLHVEGYDTLAAANGKEALDCMRRQPPRAVMLDMMMPVMDGWTFRRQQLQDPSLARVPILCMSAAADPERIESELGLVCLRKPLDFDAVLTELQAYCDSR